MAQLRSYNQNPYSHYHPNPNPSLNNNIVDILRDIQLRLSIIESNASNHHQIPNQFQNQFHPSRNPNSKHTIPQIPMQPNRPFQPATFATITRTIPHMTKPLLPNYFPNERAQPPTFSMVNCTIPQATRPLKSNQVLNERAQSTIKNQQYQNPNKPTSIYIKNQQYQNPNKPTSIYNNNQNRQFHAPYQTERNQYKLPQQYYPQKPNIRFPDSILPIFRILRSYCNNRHSYRLFIQDRKNEAAQNEKFIQHTANTIMGIRLNKDNSPQATSIKNNIKSHISKAIQLTKPYYEDSYIRMDKEYLSNFPKNNPIPINHIQTMTTLIIQNIQNRRFGRQAKNSILHDIQNIFQDNPIPIEIPTEASQTTIPMNIDLNITQKQDFTRPQLELLPGFELRTFESIIKTPNHYTRR
jgi:hypothetical protein